MKYLIEKEYHPVIEDFITDYVDGKLDVIETSIFEETLFEDDDLRELVFSAKAGKELLSKLQVYKSAQNFEKRLSQKLNKG